MNCHSYVTIGSPVVARAVSICAACCEVGYRPSQVTSDNSVPDRARAEAHRILAIEDDSATQRALKRLFESEGYDVDLAKDGTSGLEFFRKRRPSAIVLDLRVPDISGR
jgi:PleD family two-component response regulator